MNNTHIVATSDYLNYILVLVLSLAITLPLAWKFSAARRRRRSAVCAFTAAAAVSLLLAAPFWDGTGLLYSFTALLMISLTGLAAIAAGE